MEMEPEEEDEGAREVVDRRLEAWDEEGIWGNEEVIE